MKHAQVINLNEDSVLAFIYYDVIEDGTQTPINELETSSLLVDLKLWDLMSNAPVSIEGVTMSYQNQSKYWTIDVADISGVLQDRHKYVGTIYPNTSEPESLKPFQITEFAVDNESLDDILMRMSYEIVINGGQAWFFWYTPGHHGEESYRRFTAPAYEGGTGTTYATDPSRVTHRGVIEPYYAGP